MQINKINMYVHCYIQTSSDQKEKKLLLLVYGAREGVWAAAGKKLVIATILLLACYICGHMSICNGHNAFITTNGVCFLPKIIPKTRILKKKIKLSTHFVNMTAREKESQPASQPYNFWATICHIDLCNGNNLHFWNFIPLH